MKRLIWDVALLFLGTFPVISHERVSEKGVLALSQSLEAKFDGLHQKELAQIWQELFAKSTKICLLEGNVSVLVSYLCLIDDQKGDGEMR